MLQPETSSCGYRLLLWLSLLAEREGETRAQPQRVRRRMLLCQGERDPWLLKSISKLPALCGRAEALRWLCEPHKR